VTTISYRGLFAPEPDERIHAWAPELPGCHTFGDTPEEALEHLRDAVDLYVETLRDEGLELPAPATETMAHVSRRAVFEWVKRP
jgi:predicted RNase H-like HicB family nuclease